MVRSLNFGRTSCDGWTVQHFPDLHSPDPFSDDNDLVGRCLEMCQTSLLLLALHCPRWNGTVFVRLVFVDLRKYRATFSCIPTNPDSALGDDYCTGERLYMNQILLRLICLYPGRWNGASVVSLRSYKHRIHCATLTAISLTPIVRLVSPELLLYKRPHYLAATTQSSTILQHLQTRTADDLQPFQVARSR